MHGFASAVDTFVPAFKFLHLKATVAQFMQAIAVQARLDIEARYLSEMGRNFAGRAWRDIILPKPLFATSDVIIETFVPGKPVGALRGKLSRSSARFIVNRGQDAYIKMLMVDRFMHADMHPGNMLVDISETGETVEALVLVDLGMVARLSAEEQTNFVGMMRSLGNGDGVSAAAYILRFCSPGKQACVEACAESFSNDIVSLFKRVCRGFGTGTKFGEVLRGVMLLVRRHKVTISANYATLVVNALCLDGLAADLAPDYNLLDGMSSLLRLSWLGQTPLGAIFVRALYPVVSFLKVSSDQRFRRGILRNTASSRDKPVPTIS